MIQVVAAGVRPEKSGSCTSTDGFHPRALAGGGQRDGWVGVFAAPLNLPPLQKDPTMGTNNGESVESPDNLADADPAGFRDIRLLEAEVDRVKAAYKQMKAEFDEVKTGLAELKTRTEHLKIRDEVRPVRRIVLA
jgi:hypothetical protein